MHIKHAADTHPKAYLCINCKDVHDIGYNSKAWEKAATNSDIFDDELEGIDDWDILENEWPDLVPMVEDNKKDKEPKCECGAEKARSAYHSTWCPLYKDPMSGKGVKKK